MQPSDNLQLIPKMHTPKLDKNLYQYMVEKLIFLCQTQPNVTFVVNMVSQLSNKPQKPHIEVVKYIFRSIKSTFDLGLYHHHGKVSKLLRFFDIDWADDKCDKKSTSNYIFLGSMPIIWHMQK